MLSVSDATLTVHVRLFSVLRTELGTDALDVTLDAPATGADLLDTLSDRHPAVADHRDALRLAVNAAYVPDEASLSDGDEVALITPVSGG